MIARQVIVHLLLLQMEELAGDDGLSLIALLNPSRRGLGPLIESWKRRHWQGSQNGIPRYWCRLQYPPGMLFCGCVPKESMTRRF